MECFRVRIARRTGRIGNVAWSPTRLWRVDMQITWNRSLKLPGQPDDQKDSDSEVKRSAFYFPDWSGCNSPTKLSHNTVKWLHLPPIKWNLLMNNIRPLWTGSVICTILSSKRISLMCWSDKKAQWPSFTKFRLLLMQYENKTKNDVDSHRNARTFPIWIKGWPELDNKTNF